MSTPSESAAICARIVYIPVPRSCVALATSIVPSAPIVTRASAGARIAGYVAVATPHPISSSPARIERGACVRVLQPNASAPRS